MKRTIFPIIIIAMFAGPVNAHDATKEINCTLDLSSVIMEDFGYNRYTVAFTVQNTTKKTISSAVFKLLNKSGKQIGSVNFGGKYSKIKNGLKPGDSISAGQFADGVNTIFWSKDAAEKKTQLDRHQKIKREMQKNLTGAYCKFISFGKK